MVDRAIKIFDTVKIRCVCRRKTAYCGDAELSGYGVAVICLDAPSFDRLVEDRRGDTGMEMDVGSLVETVGNVIGIV